tara:strand:+ start:10397 stop:11491 length:1095 start_codon:yes stop_codon:yes gene_type:complete
MATPSGQISFENIRSEFGQPQANNALSNYYSGGPALGAPLANVPPSGAISMSQLRSIEKRSASGNQVNAASGVPNGTSLIFFTSGECYSNSTGAAALNLPGSRTGASTMVINHGVYGKSGNGGSGQPVTYADNGNAAPTGSAGNGGGGGPAITLGSPVHVDNNSTVYGGSGGGGGGSAYGANITGAIDNGITCTSSTFKGITTNTNGSTAFTIGSGGAGGGGGNQNNNNADGSGGGAGGGGHTTNFASGNQVVNISGTQCAANSSYFVARVVKLVSNQGNFSNTTGGPGGSNGGGGSGRSGTSGTVSFPGVNANGVNVSSRAVNANGDASSGGGSGNSFNNFGTYSTTVHGIGSTSGITGGNFS